MNRCLKKLLTWLKHVRESMRDDDDVRVRRLVDWLIRRLERIIGLYDEYGWLLFFGKLLFHIIDPSYLQRLIEILSQYL
ncbi:hypothetical protein TOL_0342 [Thalassolituus oleivorans MIL-1]|uniref:Uncharacterized protein n=1 Tax=Thalassolituus oleivorans MIL-1 TaxID=1298593 RepID=M5DLT7_9GAMM|nr:hypothetical protein TOL_0342 [Thalassolituus oleivorans MIL-1]